MHRGDVILIGPIEPLLPRVLRVPLPVALACAAGVLCAALVAAVAMTLRPVAVGLLPVAVPGANGAAIGAPLLVISKPMDAEVRVDNRELGRTPATVHVARES